MSFTCQRPEALYGILFLIPAIIVAVFQYRQVMNNYEKITIKDDNLLPAKWLKIYWLAVS